MNSTLALCVVFISKVPKLLQKSKPNICKFPIAPYDYRIASTVEPKVIWGHKKPHRKVKLNFLNNMDPKTEETLVPFRQLVKEQVYLVLS